MDISELGKDRFLQNDPDQGDQTKGAIYVALNPIRPYSSNTNPKTGSPNSNEGPNSAQNIWTGTVITAAIIQTSALPSRAELSGNDLTLFDDTIAKNGMVQGDTSRIIFTHASADNGGNITSGFILQKRALSSNTYDNVLELFSPDNSPNTNFIFIGRMGTGADRNISLIEIDPDYRSAVGDSAGYINGVFRVRTSRDGEDDDFRDGLYIMDRGTESASRNGSVDWLVAAGEGGQVRLSYMPNRDDNPLTDAVFDIFVSAVGISIFGLPTSAPGGANTVWNNDGVLNIGPGGGGGGGSVTLNLTGTPAAGATSMTFSPAVVGVPAFNYYLVAFNGSGEVRSIFLGPGSTTVTWGYPLQTGSGTNQVTVHLS